MDRREVVHLYNDSYAATYDARFSRADRRSDDEVEIVRQLLVGDGAWLDFACGTGWALSHFPGVPRAGVDLSPAMLAEARRANPDALFLREGDLVDDVPPEWQGRWSLVTCMGYAYCLLESMAEVETLLAKLARCTSPEGAAFVPICDPLLLAGGVLRMPYSNPEVFYGGTIMMTGVTWDWIEESGRRHRNMIAPQVEHMVSLFEVYFGSVDMIEYPKSDDWRGLRRKGIIARRPTTALPPP
jgi:SAM-dependent methyltransferase